MPNRQTALPRLLLVTGMNFENQGSRVLAKEITVSGFGNHLTLTNANGTIDLVRAH